MDIIIYIRQESKTTATSPGPASASASSFEGNSNYILSSNKGHDTVNLIHGYNHVASPSPPPPFISQQIRPVSVDSFSVSSEGSGPGSFRSSEWSFEHMDHSRISDVSKTSSSTSSQIGVSCMNYSLFIMYVLFYLLTLLFELQGEFEDEMRRLKLELKQTMDMYNNACKETSVAKERVNKKEFSFPLFV